MRGVFLEKNAASELANKRSGSLVHRLSFFDCHAVGAEPRKLLDGADQAFIWALRAVPGERRLDSRSRQHETVAKKDLSRQERNREEQRGRGEDIVGGGKKRTR